jgi:hypothetical protein
MIASSNSSWFWRLSDYWKRKDRVLPQELGMKGRSVKQDPGIVTYGRIATAWSYCKPEHFLSRLILWNPNEHGRGSSITAGRDNHCISEIDWCLSQRID